MERQDDEHFGNQSASTRAGRFGTWPLRAVLTGTKATPAAAQFAGDAEKALYEAAKKEGEVTWYSAHYSAEQAEQYGQAFMTKYPGIKANVVRTTAHVAYQRLTQELKSGGPQVDAFSSTDVSHYIELKGKGLLEKFTPANRQHDAALGAKHRPRRHLLHDLDRHHWPDLSIPTR